MSQSVAGLSIGPYVLEKRLGVGGMAEVFLAKKPLGPTFKRVVVKRMLAHLVDDERYSEMFLREAGILAQMNHGNVVQIFDLGTTETGDLYIAMEYLEGINVLDLARRAWRSFRALPVELVLRVIAEAARGLDYVHRMRSPDGTALNLVHRDVAPDNLFFVRDGTIKLLDFGVARSPTMKRLTTSGELKGKIPYMAPEALEGYELDGRADLFSLGVTAFWLLTGRKPFVGNDLELVRTILKQEPQRPSALNPDVPAWIDGLVLSLLDKDRTRRTQTGAEVEREIARRAGNRLDRAGDVAFVEELLAIPDETLDDDTHPLPAIQRMHSDVFARVDTSKIAAIMPKLAMPLSPAHASATTATATQPPPVPHTSAPSVPPTTATATQDETPAVRPAMKPATTTPAATSGRNKRVKADAPSTPPASATPAPPTRQPLPDIADIDVQLPTPAPTKRASAPPTLKPPPKRTTQPTAAPAAAPASMLPSPPTTPKRPRPISFVDDPSNDPANPFELDATTAMTASQSPLLEVSRVQSADDASDEMLFDDDNEEHKLLETTRRPPLVAAGAQPSATLDDSTGVGDDLPVERPATGPLPRVIVAAGEVNEVEDGAGDAEPTSDTVRMTESQLGVRRERE